MNKVCNIYSSDRFQSFSFFETKQKVKRYHLGLSSNFIQDNNQRCSGYSNHDRLPLCVPLGGNWEASIMKSKMPSWG